MKKWIVIFLILAAAKAYPGDQFVIDEPYAGLEPGDTAAEAANNAPITAIGSIPTAESHARGEYETQFSFYDGGGFQARFMVGIFNAFSLGISENMDGLIGSSNVHLNIPGAYLKLTLFPGTTKFNAALGFDNFGFGRNASYIGTNGDLTAVYGVYASAGKSYTVFNSKNIFAFGVRFPLLPADARSISNTSFFIGATLGTPVIGMAFTIENLYLDFSRPEKILPSLIFTLSPFPGFSAQVVGQYEFDTGMFNRILCLNYRASF